MVRGRGWGVVGAVLVVAATIGYITFAATREDADDVPWGATSHWAARVTR